MLRIFRVILVIMTIKKTDKQLREETRARRAKQDLKNTPLPVK